MQQYVKSYFAIICVILTSTVRALALTPADLPSWLAVDRSFELQSPLTISGSVVDTLEFELNTDNPDSKLGYLYFGKLNSDQTVTWLSGKPGQGNGSIVEVSQQTVKFSDPALALQFEINSAQEFINSKKELENKIKVLFKQFKFTLSKEAAPTSIKAANKALFPIMFKFSEEFSLPGSRIKTRALMLEIDDAATFQGDGQVVRFGSIEADGSFVGGRGTAKWSPDKNGNLMITRMWGPAAEVLVLDLKSLRSYIQGSKTAVSPFEAFRTQKSGPYYIKPVEQSVTCSDAFTK